MCICRRPELFQVYDGQVVRMRTERALMETIQLSEARILETSASKGDAAERRQQQSA